MRPFFLALLTLALLLVPRTSFADPLEDLENRRLEDLAAQSTYIVVVRFVRALAHGNRVHVDQVIAGARNVHGNDIDVLGAYGMGPWDRRMLFVRRDGDGLVVLDEAKLDEDDNVHPSRFDEEWVVPLPRLAERLRAVQPVRVTWTAHGDEHARSDGTFSVVFVAKNEGDTSVRVTPPSYCGSVSGFAGPPQGWFSSLNEGFEVLDAGAERSFAYHIPLSALFIDHADSAHLWLEMSASTCSLPMNTTARPNFMRTQVVRLEIEGPNGRALGTLAGGWGVTGVSRGAAVRRALVFGPVALVVVASVVIWLRRRGRRRSCSA